MPATDATLLADARAGGDAAFDLLVERYRGFVATCCTRRLGRDALVDDAMQQVWLVLWEHMPSLSAEQPLEPWLGSVADLVCANLRREAARRRARETAVAPGDAISESGPTGDPAVLAAVADALADLPPPQRRLLAGRFLEEKPLAQLARAERLSIRTAYRRIEEALVEVREALTRRGVALVLVAAWTVAHEREAPAAEPAAGRSPPTPGAVRAAPIAAALAVIAVVATAVIAWRMVGTGTATAADTAVAVRGAEPVTVAAPEIGPLAASVEDPLVLVSFAELHGYRLGVSAAIPDPVWAAVAASIARAQLQRRPAMVVLAPMSRCVGASPAEREALERLATELIRRHGGVAGVRLHAMIRDLPMERVVPAEQLAWVAPMTARLAAAAPGTDADHTP